MKKIAILFTALVALALQAWSAPVDATSARSMVLDFIDSGSTYNPQGIPSSGSSIRLIRCEMSSVNPQLPAYYIFNTGSSYMVVSGDNRATGILAYGDRELDLDNMPCCLEYLLDMYKEQIDYLVAHPDEAVQAPSLNALPLAAVSIDPLLTAMWDQGYPFNKMCPELNGTRCLTGCGCTSLSMILYYWKYAQLTDPVPTYTTKTNNILLLELPVTTFDFDNMLDRYSGQYTTDQANAVAKLMRYVGQAEKMDYGTSASGTNDAKVLSAARMFGYDPSCKLEYKSSYTDEQWVAMMLEELNAGRPIEYMAQDVNGYGGHAFNVDGYDADNGLFHINFGWGGSGNGYMALDAFSGSIYTFSVNQRMITNLMPPVPEPEPEPDPAISANIDTLQIAPVTIGYKTRKTFKVYGENLQGDVTLSIDSRHSSYFSITPSTITAEEAAAGATVTVQFAPMLYGSENGTLTLSSPGAEDLVIPVLARGEDIEPTVIKHSESRTLEGEIGKLAMTSIVEVIRWADAEIPEPPFPWEYELMALPNYAAGYSVTVEGDNCFHASIIRSSASIKTCDVRIYYSPNDVGPHRAKVTISCDRAWYDVVLTITGNGIVVKSDPVILATPQDEVGFSVFVAHWQQTCPMAGVSSFTLECAPQGSGFSPDDPDYIVCDQLLPEQCQDNTGYIIFDKPEYRYSVFMLRPGVTYDYRVKALYIDETESGWSDVGTVEMPALAGDMNQDGSLSVADIVMLINVILNDEDQTRGSADVNGDGIVNISDISALISLVLNAS